MGLVQLNLCVIAAAALFCACVAEVRVGIVGYYYNTGAVSIAVENAKNAGYDLGEDISFKYVRESCSSGPEANVALDLLTKQNVDVILGVDCTPTCVGTGQVAAYYNKPFLPTNCMDERVDNKTRYSTTIRVAGSFPLYAEGYQQILQYYGWGNIVLVSQSSYDYCSSLMSTVSGRLRPYVKQIENIDMSDNPSDADLQNYAARAKYRGKIIFVCHKASAVVVRLLYAAQDLGMTDGDYVFLKVTQPYSRADSYFDLVPVDAADKPRRLEAFYSMKQLAYDEVMPESTFNAFQAEVKRRNQLAPWSDFINSTGQDPNYFSTYTYDAAYLWIALASQMKQAGLDYKNGSLMQKFSKDKVFTGLSRTMQINDNYDAKKPMLLYSFEPGNLNFRPFMKIDLSTPSKKVQLLRNDVVWGKKTVPPKDDEVPTGGVTNYYEKIVIHDDKKAVAALVIACITAGIGLIALSIAFVHCIRKQMLTTDKMPLN